MNTAIIIFITSFIGMISMICLKSYEISHEKKLLLSRLSYKVDPILNKIHSKLDNFVSYFNKQNLIALIQWIAYHVLSWIRTLYVKIRRKAHSHPPSKKVIDMVRGKENINKNGGASFYFKQISEDRIN